jgi:phage head maturation protease
MDISKLKSVEVISAASDIASTLMKRNADFLKEAAGVAATTHTRVEEGDEGIEVVKVAPAGNVLSVKLGDDELKEKCKTLNIEWNDAYPERVKQYFASDERVDRHGDIVDQTWKFDDFDNNPLMLFSHEWENYPIGNIIERKVEKKKDKDYDGPALALSALFATKETSERADQVFRLVHAGFMKAGSVGFFPGEVIVVSDEKERAELGLGRWGVILSKNSLVEWSPCSVPANPGALLRSMKMAEARKAVQPEDLLIYREVIRLGLIQHRADTKTWKELDHDIVGFWKSLFPDSKIRAIEAKNIDDSVLPPESRTSPTLPPAPAGGSTKDLIAGEFYSFDEGGKTVVARCQRAKSSGSLILPGTSRSIECTGEAPGGVFRVYEKTETGFKASDEFVLRAISTVKLAGDTPVVNTIEPDVRDRLDSLEEKIDKLIASGEGKKQTENDPKGDPEPEQETDVSKVTSILRKANKSA